MVELIDMTRMVEVYNELKEKKNADFKKQKKLQTYKVWSGHDYEPVSLPIEEQIPVQN